MKLTVYYDGQFYIGLIEIVIKRKFKAYRYTFGKEPKDQEILDFVLEHLINFIGAHAQEGVSVVRPQLFKRMNPKRLQRQAAREVRQSRISSKAQEALQVEHEHRKKEKQVTSKYLKEKKKAYIRKLKVQKAKSKHKGR